VDILEANLEVPQGIPARRLMTSNTTTDAQVVSSAMVGIAILA
jgi:hypothetical protein